MVVDKTMLCRCEDITLDDCEDAMTAGYDCFEDLKRFLGVGTGPCQGKACVRSAMQLIAKAHGIRPDEVDVMTFRPPVRPVSFATLAAEPLDHGDPPETSTKNPEQATSESSDPSGGQP